MTTLAPADLLEWVPIAAGQRCRCDHCGLELAPNDRLEALVVPDGLDAEVVVRRCRHCARGSIRPETARECVLVAGTLAAAVDGRERSRLVLSGTTVLDRSE
ncbi:hypothetical protein [Natrinema thermotolerans]|uniref:hypothetical protein n=1 Tax=Natrinema thermotolerans TaxID=121872 RepID=UPI000678EF3C|nr:hypothetical protein [Natrinema thermotolerans]QCC57294.1 hypothetical protein DVR14_01050 [Natrinema thermotolerans]